jgi:hypothetical protein
MKDRRRPLARREGLLVHRLDHETLVYDTRTFEAHCLNRTAALVWQWCDGATSLAEVSRRLGRALGRPADEDIVRLALDELRRARLLEAGRSSARAGFSRREALRRLGWGVALPAVVTIVTPTLTEAATCVTPTDCRNLAVCSQPDCCGRRPCCTISTQTCRPSGSMGRACGCA